MKDGKFRIRKIQSIERESPTVKTFRVAKPPSCKPDPGQFVMVWVPDSGEVPIAISGMEREGLELTVKRRGKTTRALHRFEPGEKIGIKGPLGKGFSPPAELNLLVGGGYGISPLKYFYERFSDQATFTVMEGASSRDELLFRDKMDLDYVATEDGSEGRKGDIIAPLKDYLAQERVDRVYASGPERMIQRTYRICKSEGIELEAALERIMRCGVGLCGSCLIDGFRVCRDGPVVDLELLDELEEFGKFERTFSGKRRSI